VKLCLLIDSGNNRQRIEFLSILNGDTAVYFCNVKDSYVKY